MEMLINLNMVFVLVVLPALAFWADRKMEKNAKR